MVTDKGTFRVVFGWILGLLAGIATSLVVGG